MKNTTHTALLLLLVVFAIGGCSTVDNTVNAVKAKTTKPVKITPDMMDMTFGSHTISRDQNTKATVNANFTKTSRPCPPFCIQPILLAPGVETLGEREVLHYLDQQHNKAANVLVIDSRTTDWVAKGTIPGAKNLPWTGLNPAKGATTDGIMKIMQDEFGVNIKGDAFAVDEAVVSGDTSKVFNFNNAKTLVLFCNGMWCGQSPSNIESLLKFGYPADKIKWYRGGMQSWSNLGLSTTK